MECRCDTSELQLHACYLHLRLSLNVAHVAVVPFTLAL